MPIPSMPMSGDFNSLNSLPKFVETINPFKEKALSDFRLQSEEEALIEVEKAHMAFEKWSALTIDDRAHVLARFSEILLRRKDELAQLITDEMGKRMAESLSEVEAVSRIAQWCAQNGARYLADEERYVDGGKSAFISYCPLGVIFSIQPWNFPLYQIVRDSAPKLMAGNASVCKHAPNVWGVAELVEEIYHEAGIVPNAFKCLYVDTATAKSVIESKYVQGVSFTGSPKAGAKVAAIAGGALKKSVLELGGSDGYIICEDADLDYAIDICAQSRLRNAGQTCTSPKRFIILDDVYEKFKEGMIAKFKDAQLGDPKALETRLAPLARKDLLEKLDRQIDRSIEMGAKCLLGGNIEKRQGFFYQATVLENIKPGMPAYDEEIFGPVACLFRAKSLEEAIQIANDSSYGLGAGIFTKDFKLAQDVARNRLNAGMATINGITSSHKTMPFGGIKDSGYGREHGEYGFREFCNIKSVVVKG